MKVRIRASSTAAELSVVILPPGHLLVRFLPVFGEINYSRPATQVLIPILLPAAQESQQPVSRLVRHGGQFAHRRQRHAILIGEAHMEAPWMSVAVSFNVAPFTVDPDP